MAEHEIYPLDKDVKFEFICPFCRRRQHSKTFEVPEPNFKIRSFSRSLVINHYMMECKNLYCKQEFDVFISNSIMGGEVEVTNLSEEDVIRWKISEKN